MLKLNRLLYSSVDDHVFLDNILPTNGQETVLRDAKNKIRDYLKPGIRAATVTVLGLATMVTPRFRTQGSWSYGTCVQPAWMPYQEMDWDFGVYLPISVWEANGPPHAMAKSYFDLVEALLTELCKTEKGWSLELNNKKCIRVKVAEWGHIDVPLYAVPEDEFEQIMERALAARQLAKADSTYTMDAEPELAEQEWAEFDHIMLATRDRVWVKSDSKKVSDWFLDRVTEHKEQVRRICMYLKAWRDFHWKEGGGPTSVAIMVAVAQSFERHERRDDLALEHSAKVLANAIKGEIREDGINEGEEDFNRLDAAARGEASKKAQALVTAIRQARALAVGSELSAIAIIVQVLGKRVPTRADLVEADSGESVRQVPARTVPPPVVPSTKAG